MPKSNDSPKRFSLLHLAFPSKSMIFPEMYHRLDFSTEEDLTTFMLEMLKGSTRVFVTMSDDEGHTFSNVGVIASTVVSKNSPTSAIDLKGVLRGKIIGQDIGADGEPDDQYVLVEEFSDDAYAYSENPLEFNIDISRLTNSMYRAIVYMGHDNDDRRLVRLNSIYNRLLEMRPRKSDTLDVLIWELISCLEFDFKDKNNLLRTKYLYIRINSCINYFTTQYCAREDMGQGWEPENDFSKPGQPPIPRKADSRLHPDLKKILDKLEKVSSSMNKDARKVVEEDIETLKSFISPEVGRSEWSKYLRRASEVVAMPWNNETEVETDITRVAKILDEDHFGLKQPKDRICESLAARILNPDSKGAILCFVGPPGVGKTSLGKSIARATNRKFIRISLGGIRDESQIRGHGFTYSGSSSGQIIQQIKRAGVRNPVFVIDEIDKLGHESIAGDPSAAMLEVLDPEQNNSFVDHYLNCPFDLSKVMFIATANVEERIPEPLRDRMDIIRLPGYLEHEKVEIANQFIISRKMQETGLTQNEVNVAWNNNVLEQIIRGYTSEAGVRNLERVIATILKKVGRKYLKRKQKSFKITKDVIKEFLGPPRFFRDKARPTKVGEAIGLAWTPVGGELLFIQSKTYPRQKDKKIFAQTGLQRDVMREANEVAMTLLRIKMEEEKNEKAHKKLTDRAMHVHIPDGAIPKDGPSAGITVFVSMYSEVTGLVVKKLLAMTGEINLLGHVTQVGGIREKIIAAKNAGIKEVILPKENHKKHLYDIPKEIKDVLVIHLVKTVNDVVKISFQQSQPAR